MNKLRNIVETLLICGLAFFLGIVVCDLTKALIRQTSPAPARAVTATPEVYTLPPTPDNGIVRLVDNGRTFCTGSIVDDKTIITAGHCIAVMTPFGMMVNPNPIEIRLNDNVSRNTYAKPHSMTLQLDSAVLKGDFKAYKKLKLIDDIHQIQNIGKQHTKLLACGYPLSGNLHCQGVVYVELNNFMWSVEGLLLPGMSGGPVITPEGSVIGINDAVEGNKSIIAPTYNIKRGF